jgi:polynucleotide 5'-hydroxyl-kinase GRC3/NOL9
LRTDCGQPESTPPGLVSLSFLSSPIVGPPHLHQHTPAASYFIGDTSPSTDPARYLCSITNLYEWYCAHGGIINNSNTTRNKSSAAQGKSKKAPSSNKKLSPPPLVVNTHGWVKGFGFDLLVDTLRTLSPTHYVHILSSNPRRNLPHGVFWAVPPPPLAGEDISSINGTGSSQQQQQQQMMPVMFDLPAIDPPFNANGGAGGGPRGGRETTAGSGHESEANTTPIGPQGTSRRPAAKAAPPAAVEQRALHWVSFAQRCIKAHSLSDTSPPAAAAAAALTEKSDMFINSCAEEVGDQLASAIPYVISLSDVYIRVIHTSILPEQLAYALNGAIVGLCGKQHQGTGSGVGSNYGSYDSLAPCLGLGLVRTADGSSGKLYILTPLSLEELENVETIEIGRLELPPALLQTGKFLSPYLALHSLSTAGTGAGAIKSRNNLMRSGQR